MTGLEELRSTLREQADAVADIGLAARTGAVHQRVRVTRRRRRAGVALVAALLVGGTVVSTQMLERRTTDADPADTVLGQQLPRDIRIDGVRYHLTDTLDLRPGKPATVPGTAGRGVLSSLVAADLDTSASYVASGEQRGRLWTDGVTPATWASPDETVRVRSEDPDARFALAVYTPTDDIGPAETGNGVSFRRHIGDDRLVETRFTAADQTPRLSMTLGAGGQYDLSLVCVTDRTGLWVRFVGPDGTDFARPCGRRSVPLPETGSFGIVTGKARRLTVEVAEGRRGPVVDDLGAAILSLGVYRQSDTAYVKVAGYQVPRYAAFGVRRFVLERAIIGSRAQAGVPVETPQGADGDRVIGVLTTASGQEPGTGVIAVAASWRGATQNGSTAYIGASPGGSTSSGLLLSGDRATVRVRDTEGRPAAGAILIYRPVD